MEGFVRLIVFASLVTLSMSQCTGMMNNSTARVAVTWNVIGKNSVRFTFSAPSNDSQFTALLFSTRSTGFSLSSEVGVYDADTVLAGSNGTNGLSFVLDMWVNGSDVRIDTQVDITSTSTVVASGVRTTSFTRPIISTDKVNDTDLNTCHYIGWAYGGVVESYTPDQLPSISQPTILGVFDIPICLNQAICCLPQAAGASGIFLSLAAVIATTVIAVVIA